MIYQRLRQAFRNSTKTRKKRFANSQAGSAFIIVIASSFVFALALVGGLQILKSRSELGHIRQTNLALTKVNAALIGYVNRTGTYPCPDLAATALTADHAGLAAASCSAQTPTWGLVPWRTLGLAFQDAQDGWGNRIVYAMGTSGGVGGVNDSACTASGSVATGTLTAPSSIPSTSYSGLIAGPTAPYVLISPGPNQRGAVTGSAIQTPIPAGALETWNCARDFSGTNQCDANSGRTIYVIGPATARLSGNQSTTWFDDTVMTPNTAAFDGACVEPTGAAWSATGASIVGNTLTAPGTGSSATATITYSFNNTPAPIGWRVWIDASSTLPNAASGSVGYSASTVPAAPSTLAAGTTTQAYQFTINGKSSVNASYSLVLHASNMLNTGWGSAQPTEIVSTLTVTYN